MTADECSSARFCRVAGTLSVANVEGVAMGKLQPAEGVCINVSLPDSEIRRLASTGAQETVIYGRVWPSPQGDPDLVTLAVQGRRIGWQQCGDFYVFVR